MAGNLSLGAPVGHGRGSFADSRWPDPFMDAASTAMPTTIQDALRWVEFIILNNGPYRQALSRVISYFITDVQIVSSGTGDDDKRLSREDRKKYEDFLNDTLGIKTILQDVALDFLVYGNSFTSLHVPFRRYLACPGCGATFPLKRVHSNKAFKFSWSNFEFHATCIACQYSGKWKHLDRRSHESNKIKVKRWSPHEIGIVHDQHSGNNQYYWRIPDDYRNLLRQGTLFHLEEAPWEVIQAVKNNEVLFFDPDIIHHMKEETLAGVLNRGWGVSRVLTNFRQAWYVQVLHRFNEAIALDYIVPFRVVTPQPRAGQGGEINDPVLSINMGSFTSRVMGMISQRRQDPARWNVLPFPIEYQALGGDATQLAPKDLIELGMDTLLTSIGIPVEMYKGTMSMQTAMPAMRLFEANWSYLTHNMNRFLMRLVEHVARVMNWEPVSCRLQRVTHADDLNRQMAVLQLMMGGQTSRTTGLASVGLDFIEEERKKLEEERMVSEETQEMQKEMEQLAQMDELAATPPEAAAGGAPPGAAPPGGAPPGAAPPMPGGMPGGMPAAGPMGPMGQPAGPYGAMQAFMAGQPLLPNTPTTPEEMMMMADTLAQQAMGMPESMKDSFLIRLKKENPVIHSLVKEKLAQYRRDAQVQGGAMLMQQQQQAQAAMPQDPGAKMAAAGSARFQLDRRRLRQSWSGSAMTRSAYLWN